MDAMFTTAALASAETIINAALDYDPATRIALAQLAPQVLAIKIDTPEFNIFIAPDNNGVRLLGQYEGDITTQLQGSLPALISLINSDRVNLKDSGVQLIGSTSLLIDLQKILARLDIDWEEILSKLLGDILGPQSAQLIRKKISWGKTRADNLRRLAGDFLIEELQVLPSKPALEFFYHQVDEVKLGVDRIEARLAQLAKSLQQ